MNRTFRAAVCTLLFLTAACRPEVDVTAAAQELLETDRMWGKLADANAPVDSVVAYWTPDARVVFPGQPVVVGTAAIREMVAATRAIPGFHITWTPDSATVSASGDMGYTFGTNRVTAPDPAGALSTMEGRYITVWRKEPDGPWRCVLDISNEGPKPTESPAPQR